MAKKKESQIPKGRLQAVLWFMSEHTFKFIGLLIVVVSAILIVSVGWVCGRDKAGNFKIKEINKPSVNIRIGNPKQGEK